jgi:CheY-like chemotaxis protein
MNKLNKKILILIVEDEKILADTLKEKLEEEGFDVFNVYDGLEGFNVAIKEHPDLILLDLLMPKVDGIKMINKLRQDPWGASAKIIILTNVANSANLSNHNDVKNICLEDCEYLVKTDWSLDKITDLIKKKLDINN